ncbi:MAG: Cof-type HAD-IIB family hydrolase [Roseburia sp.]|nr:Cof-type HAD-IIB family hydrolase [Anaeroplasma bactoclasticum]MCM1196899.1 Cof-type HAD-IIB family hydrolase [Roseburia sp.]MCM1556712.1 Cof-type HAD-IIB family hydrolase [Anaeroplasma bactoclasticum]
MIKLCTIDLDGTLFDNQKRISDENKLAIRKAKANGCKVVIATGRPYNGVLPVLKELNLVSDKDYVICYNGAKVFNTKTMELIFSTTISGKMVKELYVESKRLGTYFHAFKKNEDLITDEHNPYTDVEVRINKIIDHIVDFNMVGDNEEFLKCMMVGEGSAIDNAMKNLNLKYYETYSVVRSSSIFLEFLNKITNKGTALEALASYLDIKMEETMAIGDAGNDLAMIEKASVGVAMENSFPEVKKVANFITTSNESSGVAKALNRFVNSK